MGLLRGPADGERPARPHHVLSRVFKDIFPRYKTMRGSYVERKAGWDCHGLPVEIEVEQKLGITKRRRSSATASRSSTKCRESVFEYLEEWNG